MRVLPRASSCRAGACATPRTKVSALRQAQGRPFDIVGQASRGSGSLCVCPVDSECSVSQLSGVILGCWKDSPPAWSTRLERRRLREDGRSESQCCGNFVPAGRRTKIPATPLGVRQGERGDDSTLQASPPPLCIPSRSVARMSATVFPWMGFSPHCMSSPCLELGTPSGWCFRRF